MALSIKHPEADRLARELAAATGENLTEAVLKALRRPAPARRPRAGRDHRLRRTRPAALMVIDTSAIIAILFQEPEAAAFSSAIEGDAIRLMSAASVLEASIVVEAASGETGGRELDLLLYKAGIEIAAVTADQVELARRAYRAYGKGRHAAGLNYGDCFAYALAKASAEPLLYKGGDFAMTDIAPALPAIP